MNYKDTVMSANDLCILVCREHQEKTLKGKNCAGSDCENCQLEAQAKVTAKGIIEWGNKECRHKKGFSNTECFVCWQELEEAVK